MSFAQPDGYLAMPTRNNGSKGNPVLVLHAWWGLNDTIKKLCDRLAENGYVAFAPDLYHGKVTDQIDQAEALANELQPKETPTRAELAEAVAYLRQQAGSGAEGVAVVGFSLGANYALDLSVNAADDIRTVVVFYGTCAADFSKAKAEYQGHFAEHDPFEPPESVKWLEGVLKEAGRTVTFYQYEGTGHWFFEPDRTQAYNQAAANLAWERMLAFLKRSTNQ